MNYPFEYTERDSTKEIRYFDKFIEKYNCCLNIYLFIVVSVQF